jgi:hypothetical protein
LTGAERKQDRHQERETQLRRRGCLDIALARELPLFAPHPERRADSPSSQDRVLASVLVIEIQDFAT